MAPVILLVQVDVDVDVTSVVVGLQVERLGHRLRRGVKLDGHVVVLAPIHVPADAGGYVQAVVGSDLEILDRELHRVVALLNRWVDLAGLAVPDQVVLGELAGVVREVVFMVIVIIMVIVITVITVIIVVVVVVVVVVVPHLALPAVAVVGAVVVGAVVVLHLVLDPVVGQVERGGRLLAWSVEGEP